jgi:hypothetical protein
MNNSMEISLKIVEVGGNGLIFHYITKSYRVREISI